MPAAVSACRAAVPPALAVDAAAGAAELKDQTVGVERGSYDRGARDRDAVNLTR